MKNPSKAHPSTALLFDQVKSLLNVKSDRALAERLEQSTTSICRMRSEQRPLNPQTIISIHEETLLSIYAIRSLSGLPAGRPQPSSEIIYLLQASRYYQTIVEAGFCFCVTTRPPSLSHAPLKPDYILVLQECTGYRSEPGGAYAICYEEINEFDVLFPIFFTGLEHSRVKLLQRRFVDFCDVRTLNMIDSILSEMIDECPRFYAIKAEHEADLIAGSLPQQPTQPITNTKRGRL